MSAPPQAKESPITDKAQLTAYLAVGCKPPGAWRIGTEHEKFAYTRENLRPLPYEGARGIRALLEGLVERFGWERAFMVLAIGPAFGIWSMLRLRSLPEATRMASGNR